MVGQENHFRVFVRKVLHDLRTAETNAQHRTNPGDQAVNVILTTPRKLNFDRHVLILPEDDGNINLFSQKTSRRAGERATPRTGLDNLGGPT